MTLNRAVLTLQRTVDALPTPERKAGAAVGDLIREAAAMTDLGGDAKRAAVREALKALLFGASLDNEKAFLDELIDLRGLGEFLSDRALDVAVSDRVVNRVLDLGVQMAYDAMKRSGVAL